MVDAAPVFSFSRVSLVPRFPCVPCAPSDTCPNASRQFPRRRSCRASGDPSCLPRGARGLACRPATLRNARDQRPLETLQAPPTGAHPNMRFFTTSGCAAWASPGTIYSTSGGICQRMATRRRAREMPGRLEKEPRSRPGLATRPGDGGDGRWTESWRIVAPTRLRGLPGGGRRGRARPSGHGVW